MNILRQYKNKSCKVLMEEKQRVHNSSKKTPSISLNNNYFQIFTSILLNCSFKISKIYPAHKSFSEGFAETWKRLK